MVNTQPRQPTTSTCPKSFMLRVMNMIGRLYGVFKFHHRSNHLCDYKIIVDAISSRSHFLLFGLGHLLAQVHCLFHPNDNYKLCFLRRQTNKIVHALAMVSLSYPRPDNFHFVPACIDYLKRLS